LVSTEPFSPRFIGFLALASGLAVASIAEFLSPERLGLVKALRYGGAVAGLAVLLITFLSAPCQVLDLLVRYNFLVFIYEFLLSFFGLSC
jgi:hypothetical protein